MKLMKFKSQVYTEVSGSIGGITYAHNRGGMYARAKSIPVNPNSPLQAFVRANFALVTGLWSSQNEAARNSWRNYAAGTPVTDQFGDSRELSGSQMFQRVNCFKLAAGLAAQLTAPVTPGLTIAGQPVLTVTAGSFSLAFSDADAWANQNGGALVVQMGRQQSVGINFFEGPMRIATTVLGDGTTPPTTPVVLTSPFGETATVGLKTFVRATAIDGDGKMSSVMYASDIAE